MPCSCQQNSSVQIDNTTGEILGDVLYTSSVSNNCPPMSKVLTIIGKRDEYLNSQTHPEGVTTEELIEMIAPLVHVINSKSTCGNAELIEQYYTKLGL